MSQVTQRLKALRSAMESHGVDYYLVPTSDEHLNEYLPPWRCRREVMSGFTGSAGDLLVGRSDAWMYVDGRYHLQADLELEGTGIAPMKVGLKEARPLLKHLKELAQELGVTMIARAKGKHFLVYNGASNIVFDA